MKARRKKKMLFAAVLVIGLACQGHAGDRKSTGALQQSTRAILAAPAPNVGAGTGARRESSTVGLFETGDRRSENDGENRSERVREHKALTLFHINSKFGDVAVQPVIGKVNGAQFSLGF